VKQPGVIRRTCSILAELMGGMIHDRRSLVKAHGVELAAADRYIRELLQVPGVGSHREGKALKISWVGIETGLRVMVSAQVADLLFQLATVGLYGDTRATVAERLIDQGLERFVEVPKLVPRGRRRAA
jgi:hypothetical protein